MKPPNCEAAWEARLFQTLPWNKIWRIKSFFTSARDALTWLKLMHRNLYVANRDPSIQNKQCKAINCPHDESMMHLAQCTEIRRYFWDRIIDLMKRLNVRCVNSLTFLILGCISNNKVVCKVGAGILQLAWRCLYAEVVRARIDDKNLNFRKTYKRTIIILINRVK